MDYDHQLTMEKVSQLFEKGEFKEAFCALTSAYAQCESSEGKEELFNVLMDAYYLPNEQALKENYDKNLKLLESYPYIIGQRPVNFDELPFILVPIVDGVFCCYDKVKDQFLEEYAPESDRYMKYFFKDLSKPIKDIDEDNFYNLMFLNDNVRRSEDIAAENHIYLVYPSSGPLERLMLTCDMGELLEERKFVFLFGNEGEAEYPIDFKEKYGIDYSQFPLKEVGLDDIKRFIFGWKIVNEVGTSFLANIMDFHPDLLTIPDYLISDFPDFYDKNLKGINPKKAINTLKSTSNLDARKKFLVKLVCNELQEGSLADPEALNTVTTDQLLDKLLELLKDKSALSAKDWLTAIYLAFSYCRGRTFSDRIFPAVFHYPHNNAMYYIGNINRPLLDFYFDITLAFPYHKAIAIMRDPVTYIANVIRFATTIRHDALNENGEIQTDPFYEMAFSAFFPKDFYFPKQHPMFDCSAVVRLEDLKLNPIATLTALGEFMNIPVTESLFHTTWSGIERIDEDTIGKPLSGYDPVSIFEEHPDYLSVFDTYRIEMAMLPFFRSYGYEPKYYDGQVFSDQEKMALLTLPYITESIKTVAPAEVKAAHRKNAVNFMGITLAIKEFPFTISTIEGDCCPLMWLRPKEELLETPLYRSRKALKQ